MDFKINIQSFRSTLEQSRLNWTLLSTVSAIAFSSSALYFFVGSPFISALVNGLIQTPLLTNMFALINLNTAHIQVILPALSLSGFGIIAGIALVTSLTGFYYAFKLDQDILNLDSDLRNSLFFSANTIHLEGQRIKGITSPRVQLRLLKTLARQTSGLIQFNQPDQRPSFLRSIHDLFMFTEALTWVKEMIPALKDSLKNPIQSGLKVLFGLFGMLIIAVLIPTYLLLPHLKTLWTSFDTPSNHVFKCILSLTVMSSLISLAVYSPLILSMAGLSLPMGLSVPLQLALGTLGVMLGKHFTDRQLLTPRKWTNPEIVELANEYTHTGQPQKSDLNQIEEALNTQYSQTLKGQMWRISTYVTAGLASLATGALWINIASMLHWFTLPASLHMLQFPLPVMPPVLAGVMGLMAIALTARIMYAATSQYHYAQQGQAAPSYIGEGQNARHAPIVYATQLDQIYGAAHAYTGAGQVAGHAKQQALQQPSAPPSYEVVTHQDRLDAIKLCQDIINGQQSLTAETTALITQILSTNFEDVQVNGALLADKRPSLAYIENLEMEALARAMRS